MSLALLQSPATDRRIKSSRESAFYVGGEENLKRLVDAGYLHPWKQNARDIQYDTVDLDTAIERVKREGWPEPTKGQKKPANGTTKLG